MDLFESTSLNAYVPVPFFSGITPRKKEKKKWMEFEVIFLFRMLRYHGRCILVEIATLSSNFRQYTHFTVTVLSAKSLWYYPNW